VPVLIGTLGKAFGSFGAFVAGDAALVEFLVQKARPYIYTTALPQPVAAATRAALQLVQDEPWRRERVHALTARFRAGARAAGVALAPSDTPIQPVMLGSAAAALARLLRGALGALLRDLSFVELRLGLWRLRLAFVSAALLLLVVRHCSHSVRFRRRPSAAGLGPVFGFTSPPRSQCPTCPDAARGRSRRA